MKNTAMLVRLSADEKAFIHQQAEAAGLPASAYVRALAVGNVIRTKTDAAMLNELRRLGGLCKHLFNQGATPSETGAALRALEAAASRLAPR